MGHGSWAKGWILKEGAILNGQGDPNQILVDHPASPDVEMAHLGVAHLAGGQSHPNPGGLQLSVGVLLPEGIHRRRVGQGNGVPRAWQGNTPTIHDDENHWLYRCHIPLVGSWVLGVGG